MRFTALIAMVLFGAIGGLGVSPVAARARKSRSIELKVGEAKTLSIPGAREIFIGDPTIISAKLLASGDLAVSGLGIGTSSLIIVRGGRKEQYSVRVYRVPPKTLAQEARELIGGIPGVEVRVLANRVVLDGQVYTESDKSRIDAIVALYQGELESLISYDEFSATRRPMFAIEFQVIEIRDRDAHHIGPELPTALTAGGTVKFTKDLAGSTPTTAVLTGVAQTTPLMIGLNLMVQEGKAELRSRSTVITEADNPAAYDVGGAFFVRTTGINGGTLQRISYGTQLKVRPTFDERQRTVKLTLDASVSSPDFAVTVDQVPGLITNAVTTRVNLKEGETVILSGLDELSDGNTDTGLWPLASIPVVGWLFKKRESELSKRRALILVTPRLYRPGDEYHNRTIQPMLDRSHGQSKADF